jgi:hypothetical protein
MQVLFVALGASRRREAIAESAQVVEAGGRAVVLIDRVASWHGFTFAPGVEVVESAKLRLEHLPWKIQELVVFRGPQALFRAVGRGPLRRWSGRAGRAYERRIAGRVHRRLFLPAYERIWGDVQRSLVERHVMNRTSYDVMVVGDPMSMPLAARLMPDAAAGRPVRPAVRFCLDLTEFASAGGDPAGDRPGR